MYICRYSQLTKAPSRLSICLSFFLSYLSVDLLTVSYLNPNPNLNLILSSLISSIHSSISIHLTYQLLIYPSIYLSIHPSIYPYTLYGGFRKQGYSQIIHVSRIFPYKPSILGYSPFLETAIWLSLTCRSQRTRRPRPVALERSWRPRCS